MAPSRTIDIPTTGIEARIQSRDQSFDAPTCGIAPGYLQANLVVLPSKYAHDFELLCARNTVPCPLLARSARPGDFNNLVSCIPGTPDAKIAAGIDVRTDAPRYNVYLDGELLRGGVSSIEDVWDAEDHVAFLIGCSYSFESALTAADLTPAHIAYNRNVTMYRSNIPLCSAGSFTDSTYVVSMRMYRRSEVERVRHITRPYVTTHGEPVAWGWEGARALGIVNVNECQWGDVPLTRNGEAVDQARETTLEDGFVPVFWGCGVTPQEAVMKAKIPGLTMGHAPGYMIVLDVKEEDVIKRVVQ